jgi:hypothetical protein
LVTGRLAFAEGIIAFVLIVAGVALLSIPAALVVAGILLLLDKLT